MPLSEKVRIGVYLPDVRKIPYQELLAILDREFTFAFGGATILHGLDGSYLSNTGVLLKDRINLIYSDLPFVLSGNLKTLDLYAAKLQEMVFDGLEEECVLVTLQSVFHSERKMS